MNIWQDSNNAFEDLLITGQHKTKIYPCSGHAVESEKNELQNVIDNYDWKALFSKMYEIRKEESKIEEMRNEPKCSYRFHILDLNPNERNNKRN